LHSHETGKLHGEHKQYLLLCNYFRLQLVRGENWSFVMVAMHRQGMQLIIDRNINMFVSYFFRLTQTHGPHHRD